MRFLVDECTGPAVARWLRDRSHDVFSVYDESPGLGDEELLSKAYAEARIVVTNDKDFGDKVFRDRLPHRGVILLRLADERPASKIATLDRLLTDHADGLADRFVVAGERHVRFASGARCR